MTTEEMQAHIYRLKALMDDLEIKSAVVKFEMSSYSNATISIYGEEGVVGKHGVVNCRNEDPEVCVRDAEAFIRSLPTAEQRGMTKYRAKLADALDIAADEHLPEEVTAGARNSMTVVSERLIGVSK